MKPWMILLGMLVVNQARALGLPAYVEECTEVAIRKLSRSAADHGAVLLVNSLKVELIDERFFSPYKYVWFDGVAVKQDGLQIHLHCLTQKSFRPVKPCF